METAVIYARFSCSKQREASIDDQVRECREWCGRHGVNAIKVYSDYAMSGRTDERPQFQQMIANAGESDYVLVYMLDRFSRDPYDAPIYRRELERHGVKLVSALESIPDSPEGVIYEKLLEGLAACESMKTSVRTKRGMHGNALKCKANGVRVYGYATGPDGRYVVDESQAAVVREVFERVAAGESRTAVARDLAARGIKTATGRPAKYAFVNSMVANDKYIGTYRFGDVVVPGGMPSIVDEGLFREVQAMASKRRNVRGDVADYPLAGRVICGACGSTMGGTSGKGRGGVKYRYHKCPRCKCKPVPAAWLEDSITSAVRGMVADRTVAVRIAHEVEAFESSGRRDARREQAERARRDADKGLRNIQDAIEQGVVTPGMRDRIAELTAQRDKATVDLQMLDAEPGFSVEDFADFLQYGSTLDDSTLLKAFVHQCLVGESEVIVTLNFDNEKNEPARFELVRDSSSWLPSREQYRIGVTPDGEVALLIERAA